MIDFRVPHVSFDEAAYLAANRDVAEAVEKGQLSSGWHHVLLSGYKEPRAGLPASLKAEVSDYWRIVQAEMPPADLRERVHGAVDEAGFHFVGTQVAADLDAALTKHAAKASDDLSVLDFGCGCGRLISHVKRRHPKWTIKGCDIDPQAIKWCQQHLQALATFKANGHWPPLGFESSSFDLIYAISVFTHLGEEMQFAWLEDLRRLARPGALLLLSIHPFALASESQVAQMRKRGFLYSVGGGTKGLPAFYQTTLHSAAYIHDQWSRYFDIVEVMERRINNHQDLVVARRRP